MFVIYIADLLPQLNLRACLLLNFALIVVEVFYMLFNRIFILYFPVYISRVDTSHRDFEFL